MDDRRLEFLSQLAIFACVPAHELTDIVAALQRRSYLRGEYVYHDTDAANGLFIVLRGAVKTFLSSPSGKQLTVAILGMGASFGQYSLFVGKRDANAVALEDAELLFLERDIYL